MGEMSHDERSALVNRLRIAELKISEAEGGIKKDQKSFEEKVADLEQSIVDLTKQTDSASRRLREATKECKDVLEKADMADKRAEKAIAEATACRALIIDN